MKGIYLTEESKKEIEAKIALYEFCNLLPHQVGELKIFKEILESATILPVEDEQTYEYKWFERFKGSDYDTIKKSYLQQFYTNGVIIQPKQ